MLIVSLNHLDMQGDDIQNFYFNADKREKFYMRADNEFVELEGKNFIFKKALYGIKSIGSSFR